MINLQEYLPQIVILFNLTVFVIGILIFLCQIILHLRRKNETDIYKIELESGITLEDVNNELDKFIDDCFKEYRVFNINYMDRYYIKSEEQIKIKQDLGLMVGSRISPLLIRKLSLVYNGTQINDIVSHRVHIKIDQFAAEFNTVSE